MAEKKNAIHDIHVHEKCGRYRHVAGVCMPEQIVWENALCKSQNDVKYRGDSSGNEAFILVYILFAEHYFAGFIFHVCCLQMQKHSRQRFFSLHCRRFLGVCLSLLFSFHFSSRQKCSRKYFCLPSGGMCAVYVRTRCIDGTFGIRSIRHTRTACDEVVFLFRKAQFIPRKIRANESSRRQPCKLFDSFRRTRTHSHTWILLSPVCVHGGAEEKLQKSRQPFSISFIKHIFSFSGRREMRPHTIHTCQLPPHHSYFFIARICFSYC